MTSSYEKAKQRPGQSPHLPSFCDRGCVNGSPRANFDPALSIEPELQSKPKFKICYQPQAPGVYFTWRYLAKKAASRSGHSPKTTAGPP